MWSRSLTHTGIVHLVNIQERLQGRYWDERMSDRPLQDHSESVARQSELIRPMHSHIATSILGQRLQRWAELSQQWYNCGVLFG